jgi:hypothetical protein
MDNDEARMDFPAAGGLLIRKDGMLWVLVRQQARGPMRWHVAFMLGIDTLPEPADVPVLGRGGQQQH